MIDAIAILFGLIVTFLVIVVIHELGHYWAARLVGVRPETFSVGFGKTLWSRQAKSGVVWRVAAVPLGGYVRFVGDENAASLSSVPDGPALPGSLRSVSKLRQAIVVFAGPLANLILTIMLLSLVPVLSGQTAFPWVVENVSLDGKASTLLPGDEIVSIDAIEIGPETTPEAALAALKAVDEVDYQINRSGVLTAVKAPRPDLPLLGYVASGSAAESAGLKLGDHITAIDGESIASWAALQQAVASSQGAALTFDVVRAEDTFETVLTPKQQDGRWLIGVAAAPFFSLKTETPSFVDAASHGIGQTFALLKKTTVGFASSVVGRGDPCALDGPLAIGRVAGQAIQLGPEVFLTFMAVISLGLGLLNLLPIPILDGGHLLMLSVEGATGRQVGKRLQAALFIGGVTLIMYLMITATVNDIVC